MNEQKMVSKIRIDLAKNFLISSRSVNSEAARNYSNGYEQCLIDLGIIEEPKKEMTP